MNVYVNVCVNVYINVRVNVYARALRKIDLNIFLTVLALYISYDNAQQLLSEGSFGTAVVVRAWLEGSFGMVVVVRAVTKFGSSSATH